MLKEKLTIIIPTKDRHDDLKRLLKNISLQDFRPIQVIVVDGGEVSCKSILDEVRSLNIKYVKSSIPSLTVQRNMGIKSVDNEATLVTFLDDDVVLEEGSLKNMISFWELAPKDTGGAGFNLTNIPHEKTTFFEKVFLVNPEKSGDILCSGFQSKSKYVKETVSAKWLVGCATIWRKKIFKEFMFDEWYTGYAHCEDVDFSYRVGKRYRLFIVSNARAEHLSRHLYRTETIASNFSLGKMHVINRLYFVKNNPDFSIFLSLWACSGILMNNLIRGIFFRDKRLMLRAKGNMAGFFSFFAKSRKG